MEPQRTVPPVQVATDVSEVEVGEYHTLYLKTDGSLWATGLNNSGQLGDMELQTIVPHPFKLQLM